MNKKFGRSFVLQVETEVGASGSSSFVEITDPFSLQFSIRRAMMSSTQDATLKLYNLSASTRNLLFKDQNTVAKDKDGKSKWRFVKLWAGYGSFRPLVFNGQLRSAYSQREGVNFVTTIEANDSLSIGASVSNISFSGPITRKEIVQRLAKDLKGLTEAPIIGDFPSSEKTSRGVILSGNTWGLINTYTEGRATIDNGKLKVIFDDQAIVGGLPILNADTGLLSTPKRGQARMEVDMLFEPRLTLGQRIELQSESWPAVNRVYQVCGFTHSGIISPAVNGTCTTNVTLYYPGPLRIIGGEAINQ
jgi:hypothetical protein